MKKLLYLLPVIVLISLTSCQQSHLGGSNGPGIEKSVSVDTGVVVAIANTAPRYACGTGIRLQHDKVVGYVDAWSPLRFNKNVSISDEELNSFGYKYAGTPVSVGPVNTTNESITDFSVLDNMSTGELFSCWLLGWLLVILLALLLWKIGRGDFDSKAPVIPSTPAVAATPSSASSSSSSSSGGRSTTTQTSSFVEESKMLDDIMKSMKVNDVNSIEAEFPNGPKINIKSGSRKGSIDLRKGSDKPEGPNDKKQ